MDNQEDLEGGGETFSRLLQTLGRLSKALPVSAASGESDGTAEGCSASLTSLYGSSAAALPFPELYGPPLHSAISSCSVDPIMLSLVDSAAHRGNDPEAYPPLIQPMQELAYAQAPYVFVGGPVPTHFSTSVVPYFATAQPSPYASSDPAALASLLSMLERSSAGVSEFLPYDVPGGSVAGDRVPESARFRRIEQDCSSPASNPTTIAPMPPPPSSSSAAAGKCPTLASDPEDVDDDSAAGAAAPDDDDNRHQRQHLLTTSLGPGAYFRARTRRPYRHESFPEKLHRMLVQAERNGKGDVVCFTSSGRAFEIHRVDEFLSDVIPEFFRHKSISSFRRQLSMYGFKRVRDNGPDHGAYQHELFRRDKPLLCRQMKRVSELELILPDDPTAAFRN